MKRDASDLARVQQKDEDGANRFRTVRASLPFLVVQESFHFAQINAHILDKAEENVHGTSAVDLPHTVWPRVEGADWTRHRRGRQTYGQNPAMEIRDELRVQTRIIQDTWLIENGHRPIRCRVKILFYSKRFSSSFPRPKWDYNFLRPILQLTVALGFAEKLVLHPPRWYLSSASVDL